MWYSDKRSLALAIKTMVTCSKITKVKKAVAGGLRKRRDHVTTTQAQ